MSTPPFEGSSSGPDPGSLPDDAPVDNESPTVEPISTRTNEIFDQREIIEELREENEQFEIESHSDFDEDLIEVVENLLENDPEIIAEANAFASTVFGESDNEDEKLEQLSNGPPNQTKNVKKLENGSVASTSSNRNTEHRRVGVIRNFYRNFDNRIDTQWDRSIRRLRDTLKYFENESENSSDSGGEDDEQAGPSAPRENQLGIVKNEDPDIPSIITKEWIMNRLLSENIDAAQLDIIQKIAVIHGFLDDSEKDVADELLGEDDLQERKEPELNIPFHFASSPSTSNEHEESDIILTQRLLAEAHISRNTGISELDKMNQMDCLNVDLMKNIQRELEMIDISWKSFRDVAKAQFDEEDFSNCSTPEELDEDFVEHPCTSGETNGVVGEEAEKKEVDLVNFGAGSVQQRIKDIIKEMASSKIGGELENDLKFERGEDGEKGLDRKIVKLMKLRKRLKHTQERAENEVYSKAKLVRDRLLRQMNRVTALGKMSSSHFAREKEILLEEIATIRKFAKIRATQPHASIDEQFVPVVEFPYEVFEQETRHVAKKNRIPFEKYDKEIESESDIEEADKIHRTLRKYRESAMEKSLERNLRLRIHRHDTKELREPEPDRENYDKYQLKRFEKLYKKNNSLDVNYSAYNGKIGLCRKETGEPSSSGITTRFRNQAQALNVLNNEGVGKNGYGSSQLPRRSLRAIEVKPQLHQSNQMGKNVGVNGRVVEKAKNHNKSVKRVQIQESVNEIDKKRNEEEEEETEEGVGEEEEGGNSERLADDSGDESNSMEASEASNVVNRNVRGKRKMSMENNSHVGPEKRVKKQSVAKPGKYGKERGKKGEEDEENVSAKGKRNVRVGKKGSTVAKDDDEPTYCTCSRISYGEMIGCDNEKCEIEWFHFECVNLTTKPKGKWYCPDCRHPELGAKQPKSSRMDQTKRAATKL